MTSNSEINFVRILLPFMLGISCFYSIENWVYLKAISITVLSVFIALFALNLNYRTLGTYHFKHIIGVAFFLFFFLFGAALTLNEKDTLKPCHFSHSSPKIVKAYVNSEPQIGNKTIRFTAKLTTYYAGRFAYSGCGNILITIKTDSLHPLTLVYGDEFIINAEFTNILPPFNPGEFDFKYWLASKNIYQQCFVSQNMVVKTGINNGNPILNYALSIRKRQVEIYRTIIKDNEAFAVASTLILGYRADLSNDTLASYSKTGTIHALSVSGMHVGIIYMVLNWALGFLDKNQQLKIIKTLIICILIWLYSLLTGFSPSVLRSAIMLTVFVLAKTFNRNSNGYNILAFTAFCMLINNPFLIWDVGFQLSFLAVLGLIYLHPKIYKWLYFKRKWADWTWSSVSLSLAAQISTFPLSIYYFHQFPIYFILSNLFILVPITLLMYLGISILLFKLYFLGTVFEWLIIFMNSGLKWIAELPFSGINQIWINKFELVILTLILIIGLIALANYKKRLMFTAVTLLLILQSSLSLRNYRTKTQKKIFFFSLQKGYAAAFIDKKESILVSSLNKDDKNFSFYIQPALDQLAIQNIQFVKWELDTVIDSFTKKNHQIYFHGYKILLVDKNFEKKSIDHNPSFDALWIHDMPKINLGILKQSVLFKLLLIDASNSQKSLNNYQSEAKKNQILTHVLKKNKAYLIDLNPISK